MRAIVFIDGQNLYHLAKAAWLSGPAGSGPTPPYAWPSYDVAMLAQALVGKSPGRTLEQTRFYTGVPDASRNPLWHGFWINKLQYLRRSGVCVYRGRVNPGGQEKGVDVSLAVDLVQAAHERHYDVAIIVSQDWDFGPAVGLAKRIAASQGRRPIFESAYPLGPGSRSSRGIPGTVWVPIDQALYDACRDYRDYRPQPRP